MLDAAYFIFITATAVYLVISQRKELPLVVACHAVLQYLLALTFWTVDMNQYLATVLLGFIASTSVLLVWARGINYSKDLNMLKMFLALGQWTVLVILIVFISINSPYSYQLSSSASSFPGTGHTIIHPLIKVCGNLLLFTSFLQIVLNWGSKWRVKQSLRDLGPILLYFAMVVLLYLFQAPLRAFPFT